MYLSHNQPEKKLTVHLKEVHDYALDMLRQIPLSEEDSRTAEMILKIIAVSHDFGKYMTYFQKHLAGESTNDFHQHSFISALFAAHLLKDPENLPLAASWSSYAPIIAYISVLHHHGNLRDIYYDVAKSKDIERGFLKHTLNRRVNLLQKQIEDIQKNVTSILHDLSPLWTSLSIPLTLEKDLDDFLKNYTSVFDMVHRQYYYIAIKKTAPAELYYYLLLLYSCLLDADKLSAANIRRNSRLLLSEDLVDQYRMNKFDIHENTGINGWRNRIYETVMARLNELVKNSSNERIFTLTAPTGSGKTLLALSVALKWRKHIERTKGYIPRIIYALPFTSVIDQNEIVFRDVLKQIDDYHLNEHQYLIKHHHLSTISYKRENEELPLRQALLLTENWESEIIVTTFVQLFHTLIGYQNRSLKKYHQIAGSIIILDEIQNIPVEYWPLTRTVLSHIANLFSCKILLLTATQPLIFSENETIELLEGKDVKAQDFFLEQNRIELQRILDKEFYSADEWVDLFKQRFKSGKSYLAIFNTIKTSVEVFLSLRDWLKQQGYKVYYLSTNIIPLERKKRIEKIQNHLQKDKRVVVFSTQVVEAGVDLDFDIVYRDLGPIDSIIQAAGRCNRNGTQGEKGQVYITPIIRENTLEATLVYGAIHTKITLEILPHSKIQESAFYQLIYEYFKNIKHGKSTQASKGIIEAMHLLKFDSDDKSFSKNNPEYVSEFQLIQEAHQAVDVFVEVNEEAKKIWDEYIFQVVEEKDFQKRYENYLQLKNQLRQYVISAPVKVVRNLDREFFDKTKMLYLSHDILDQYYNKDYGLIRSSELVEAWIM